MIRILVIGALTVIVAGPALWLARLPQLVQAVPDPVPATEHAQLVKALRPPKRTRPLIAIVGINDATETTDYLMPAGILRRADVADVLLVATDAGPVQLYPALRVNPDATIKEFDAAFPQGADYVIVPAIKRDDPRVIHWLQGQAGQGATIIAVCAGAKVVAAAGLLDGKRATTHWYYLPGMLRRHPLIRYTPNRRMVGDGQIVTTTGISASMPMMLTLIEAIAGRDRANETARNLGLASWDARHASAAFRMTRPFALTALKNAARLWSHETLALPLINGMDEVALALTADTWSRTYRSRVQTVAMGPVVTANAITVLPDRIKDTGPSVPIPRAPAAQGLDLTLAAIGKRYGPDTADLVAMQLEYPTKPATGGS